MNYGPYKVENKMRSVKCFLSKLSHLEQGCINTLIHRNLYHNIDKIYTTLAHKLHNTNSESLGEMVFFLKLFKINLESVKNSKYLINTDFGVRPHIKKF